MKKTGVLVMVIAVLLSLSALLVSCAKESDPFRTPVDIDGTIAAIKYKSYEGREYCTLVVVYDNVTDDTQKVAALFNVGSYTSITREDSKKKLSMDDLKVGQRVRFTVVPEVISITIDPTFYGLNKDITIYDHGSSKKIVILSDGE